LQQASWRRCCFVYLRGVLRAVPKTAAHRARALLRRRPDYSVFKGPAAGSSASRLSRTTQPLAERKGRRLAAAMQSLLPDVRPTPGARKVTERATAHNPVYVR
jgi:hypothetical protein